jgi:hypothetical protein
MPDYSTPPAYFDAPPEPQRVTLTGVNIPTYDLLILILRINAVQTLIALVFGVPAYLFVAMLVQG